MEEPRIISEGGSTDYANFAKEEGGIKSQFRIRKTTVFLLVVLLVTFVGVSWFIYSRLYA